MTHCCIILATKSTHSLKVFKESRRCAEDSEYRKKKLAKAEEEAKRQTIKVVKKKPVKQHKPLYKEMSNGWSPFVD